MVAAPVRRGDRGRRVPGAPLLAGVRAQVGHVVELVHDLAPENLFEDVLEGHDAADAAELVGDDHQVLPLLEEAAQQVVELGRLDDEDDPAHQPVEGRVELVPGRRAQDVVPVHDAHDVVGVVVVDGHPAVAQQLLVGRGLGDPGRRGQGEEHRARGHHLRRRLRLEGQHVADDVGLVRLQVARAQAPPHHQQQLLVRDPLRRLARRDEARQAAAQPDDGGEGDHQRL